MKSDIIPIIDLFAGPGGLGEGFSALKRNNNHPVFRICLSIEKNPEAHSTLELRSFFRQFSGKTVPAEYYMHLRGKISRTELFKAHPREAELASQEAWRATLGKTSPEEVDTRIEKSLCGGKTWVLIGGPPCQAYSVIGRSRIGGISPNDNRVFLYEEYLRILARHMPPVFIMENVKGLLSSKVNGSPVFGQIIKDLKNPTAAVRKLKNRKTNNLHDKSYRIFSLIKKPDGFKDGGIPVYRGEDFVIRCEDYGIPQARHRVILLGIRDDLSINMPDQLIKQQRSIPVSEVLDSLPPVRSGLSREPDSSRTWSERIKDASKQSWISEIRRNGNVNVYERLQTTINILNIPKYDRGSEFAPCDQMIGYEREWFHDPDLHGVCNHSTRGHMVSDLYRYLFAACFADVHKRSPVLEDFPDSLLPAHRNIKNSLKKDYFTDRFRVQISGKPSTTVTSHIAKDGHYYIHPDPSQCRSLTVREAARLQTFPDNYFFCGPRTSQYAQVGNAVPPLLAKQIAEIVLDTLKRTGQTD